MLESDSESGELNVLTLELQSESHCGFTTAADDQRLLAVAVYFKLLKFLKADVVKHHLRYYTRCRTCSYLHAVHSVVCYCTVILVYIGESTVDIKTNADSNVITAYPHDDKPTTGMFVIYNAIFFLHMLLCSIFLHFLCVLFYY